MQKFETTKATILFVEVPDGSHIIVHDDAAKYSLVNGDRVPPIEQLDLPEGTWQFITLLKDASEDQAKTMMYQNNLLGYRNFVIESSPILLFDNALESLHSLATSLGVKGNAAVLVKVSV